MAGEKVVGKIDSLEGDGKVLIIRSTGERVIAKPGDTVFEGDTVMASASSRAVMTINSGGLSGTASVSGAESARFDGALLDRAASQIASSSKENPANVGTKPSNSTLLAFNETFPEDGITTTETVINLEEEFDPTSGGNIPEGPRDTGINQFTNIERTQLEETPDAGSKTDTGSLGRGIGEEEIPGDGFGFRNLGDGTNQEEIPDAGGNTDSGDDGNEVNNEESAPVADAIILSITDTVPVANADVRTDGEDDTISGNVLTAVNDQDGGNLTGTIDDLGADNSRSATQVVGVATTSGNLDSAGTVGVAIAGTANANGYEGGTLTVNANGTYTYVPGQGMSLGEMATDVFTYTIKDADGSLSSTTVSFTVNGATDTPTVTITGDGAVDDTVVENATVSDNFAIAAPDGIQSITIAGTSVALAALNAATEGVPVVITTTNGVLNIIDYTGSATSGTVIYTYDPTGTSRDHNTPADIVEALAITVTDNGAVTSAASTLNISITDTVPTLVADTNEINEGFSSPGVSNTVTGNVYGATGASANDNADGTLVDAVPNDTPVTSGTFTGMYGTLELGADGQYTYTVDNDNAAVDALNDDDTPLVDVFTYTVTDGDGDVATSTLSVTINGETDVVAVAPLIDSGAGEVPESTGLLAQYYTNGTVNLDSSTNAPSSALEGILEAATAATHISRLTSGVGNGLLSETATPASNEFSFGLGGNEAYSVTGLIYLERGHSYEFSGARDDALHIELGGQVMVTTAGNSFGNFNSGINDQGGANSSVSTSTFVAPESGYYTLEAYFGNIGSTGGVLLNLSDNDVVKELSADNYSLYASPQDLIAAGGQIGGFISKETGTSDHRVVDASNNGFSQGNGEYNSGVGQVAHSADGGYFALAKDGDTFSYSDGSGDVDVIGVGKLADNITLSSLSILPEGTDTISRVIIGDIPVGAILSDGVDSSNGIDTSQDIQGWNIANLTINLGGVFPVPTDTAVTLTVNATSTSSTGKEATASSTISVGILDDAYLEDTVSGSTVAVDPIISESFTTDTEQLLRGSGNNDTLTASNAGPVVLHGLGGDDVLNGADKDSSDYTGTPASENDFRLSNANGNNTIFAGSGDDTVIAGSGEDIIFAGVGSDLLTGGFANGSQENDTDTFVWREGDQGTGSEGANLETDTITDFVLGDISTGADILDFSQLLIAETAANIDNYITVSESAGDAILSIDVQGDGNTDYDFTVVLEGKGTLSLDTLIADGNVVFDGGANTIRGTTGADTLVGTTFDELIYENGTIGDNNGTTRTLGGGGNDTFIFESDDVFNRSRSYEIYDFFIGVDTSEGDVIDISAYLDGNQTVATISNYIDIDFNGFENGDVMHIFQNGDANGSGTATGGGDRDVQIKFRNDSSELADSTPLVASGLSGYNTTSELEVLQALITDGYLIIN